MLEIYTCFQGEGIRVGTPMVMVRLAGCTVGCRYCFVGSTQISMPKSKTIQDVVVGDEVYSYDEATKEVVLRPVTKLYRRLVDPSEMIKITLGSGQNNDALFVTKDHPVFIRGEWVRAGDVKVGDEIYHLTPSVRQTVYNTANLRTEETVKLSKERRSETIRLNPIRRSSEQKKRYSDAKANFYRKNSHRRPVGSKNSNWRGGAVQRHYSSLCPPELRQQVIEECQSTCQLCGAEDSRVLHHKNFDSTDHRRENLTCLCRSCNSTLNGGKHPSQQELSMQVRNGRVVTKVEGLTPHMVSRLSVDKTSKGQIEVFNIEVEGTHTYFANTCLAHNCDTRYSWKANQGNRMTPQELIDAVLAFGLKEVSLTGGEPLEHPIKVVREFLRLCYMNDLRVTIETSGVSGNPLFKPDDLMIFTTKRSLLMSIAPKLPTAECRYEMCDLDLWIMTILTANQGELQFKFVVNNVSQIEDVLSMIRGVNAYVPRPVNVILQVESDITVRDLDDFRAFQMHAYSRLMMEYLRIPREVPAWAQIRILPQLHSTVYGPKARMI